MSEVENKTAEEVAVDLIKESTGQDVSITDIEKLTLKRYENLYSNLLKESHELSARQLLRGLFNAVDIGVDSGLAPKLVSEEEAMFGGYLGQLLDLRNVILSINLQKAEENKGEENVTETK